jgi:hypothetical protein
MDGGAKEVAPLEWEFGDEEIRHQNKKAMGNDVAHNQYPHLHFTQKVG